MEETAFRANFHPRIYSEVSVDTYSLKGLVMERMDPMVCDRVAVCALGIHIAHLCQVYQLADLGPTNTAQRTPPHSSAVPQIVLLDGGSWTFHDQRPRWPI